MRIHRQTLALKHCVPFAKYTHEGILLNAARQEDAKNRKAIWSGLRSGIATMGISGMLALAGLFRRRSSKLAMKQESQELEKICAEVRQRERLIDEGKYIGVDHQQEVLGNIALEKLSASEVTPLVKAAECL
jgi:hypothetical protein